MSIRRTATAPQITPEDLSFSFANRLFGVEISDLGEIRAITFLEKGASGAWGLPTGVPTNLNVNLEIPDNTTINQIGGAKVWLKTKFLPWINTLLLAIFPAGTVAPPVILDGIEEIDRLIGTMFTLVAYPNGTVQLVERV